jgi:hypothetical protein
MKYAPLSREEIRSVISGKGCASRVPVTIHMWVYPDQFGSRRSQVEKIMAEYPEDVQMPYLRIPDIYVAPADDAQYRWVNFDDPYADSSVGLDARIAISDWSQLDGVLKTFPNPHYKALTQDNPPSDGRYRLAHWWFWLFERHWSLRGMTNALMDYYTDPDSVHRLFRALTDFYLVAVERAKHEQNADGIFTSDDVGTQTGPFFSPEIFREFFKPYYKEVIDKAHSLGMQFWLHTCGCIEPFLNDFIEIGLDVIHPIQKYTMDERRIALQYGDRIAIWAGFDVQQTIPWGSAEDVRREVRFMMDTYARPEGRFLFTAGNGINGDCPVPSLDALYDEAFAYGSEVASVKRASGR